jgi:hypothetical protein
VLVALLATVIAGMFLIAIGFELASR